MDLKNIFDCHTHTHFSFDSECDPCDSLTAAKEKGLAGFAITDHCDMEYCKLRDVKTPIEQSVGCARTMGGGVLAGIEIGEAIWHKEDADELISGGDFDIVLGSVHAARYKNYTMPYSGIDFSVFSRDEIAQCVSTLKTSTFRLVVVIVSCFFNLNKALVKLCYSNWFVSSFCRKILVLLQIMCKVQNTV